MTDTQPEIDRPLHALAEQKACLDEEAALQTLSLEDARLMFHELRVYQIELEMQNEELRRTQHELELSRARYFSLYDLAPVGYLTLNNRGLIQEANIAAASMLSDIRKNLLGKPISQFIFHEDQDLYYLHRKKVFKEKEVQIWEMRLKRVDGSLLWAHLRATPARNDEYWVTLIDITERKQAEEELSLFFNLVPDMVCIASADGYFRKVNSAFTDTLGFSEQELLAIPFLDLIHPDDKKVTEAEMDRQMSGGRTFFFVNRYRHKNGSYRWLEWMAVPVIDETMLLYAAARDVTERKQAERVLQARLRISDYALDHSLETLLTKMLDEAEALTESRIGFFHFVEADQVTLSLQTWSSNTLTTICTADITPQHYALDKAGVWADCIRERRSLIHNDYERLPNKRGLPPGHAPVLRELVVPVFRNNLIVAVLGVGNRQTDYTELEMVTLQQLANLSWDIIVRKRAEETLSTTELKYSRLFEGMSDAYCCVDMGGHIFESNSAFQKMTGYGPDELPSLTYVALTPEKWHAFEMDIIENQVLVRGYSDVYQKEYQRKDGTIIDVELKTFVFKNEAGKPAGMWAIIRDITDRKQAELALRQAKQGAEAASRAKSEFLATMSHEIRTPLSALLGNVELLEDSPLTPSQQEYLNDCKTASQMLLQVINDVLDFSKIEAGKLELASEEFSVAAMAGQLVRMFSGTAKQNGLDLVLTLADDLPECIIGDQQRLRQIISNLLGNAIKFTNCGTVSLEITREQAPPAEEPEKAVLRIVVRDTGIGIPHDKQEHIFETFTQLEDFSTRRVSGTGLGLPICRSLLSLMNGTLVLASEPGKGSAFTILLPVTLADAGTQLHGQGRSLPPVQAHSRKILLADDDERGRSVAQKLLQRRGYTVTAVENGSQLLEALQKETFEIVLTDISMPDMEGTQVARIIRSGERDGINPKIPIIAMTAHAFSDDRARFLAAGINGYVAKPVNLDELFRQIEELCGG